LRSAVRHIDEHPDIGEDPLSGDDFHLALYLCYERASGGERAASRRGARIFSPVASLLAPLWVIERGICVWIAVAQRVFAGGVSYRGYE
jgi:hypothetical protein